MEKPIPPVKLDEDGYLTIPYVWTPEVAAFLARQQGLADLSSEHWKVIHCLRDYYLEFGIPTPVNLLCKETGLTLRQIYNLFPSGLRDGAVKIAGLPKLSGLYP